MASSEAEEALRRLVAAEAKYHAVSDAAPGVIDLVNHRARVHSGRSWVESALGAGATFHFTLPTREVQP
ncbi:MAG: hypothetical protein U0841_00820 [Chloroflexia bacterium]